MLVGIATSGCPGGAEVHALGSMDGIIKRQAGNYIYPDEIPVCDLPLRYDLHLLLPWNLRRVASPVQFILNR